ncbi:MAG: hypothetical protein H6741_05690 [Alphaproteobacteria bacterium]|nr:hypothetical protein [Alphaproteobacteria bacterium]MCB9792199.1 hypothetical protein [Alphaproteobacteria bacterium]
MSETPDRLTLIAMGVIAFTIKVTVHEWLGHGGAGWLAGCEAQAVSSAWWDGDCSALADPEAARRLERMGGTFANLIVAALAAGGLLALRRRPGVLGAGAFFAWLLFVTNLLSGGGYMMVDPLFGFGDWTGVLESLDQPALRWVIVGVGLALSALGLVLGRRWLLPWLGQGEAERRARSRSLVLLPYLAGATAVPLSAALNPYGLEFVFTSALSTFGGCAWMVWIAMDPLVEAEEARVGRLPSGRGWWVGGALALLYLFALLGPSLRFS